MSTTITDRGILITAREAAFLADAISPTVRPVPRVRMPSSNPKNSRWAMSRWPQGRGHIHSSLREARSTPAAAVSTGFLARARPPAAQHLSASSVCRTRRV